MLVKFFSELAVVCLYVMTHTCVVKKRIAIIKGHDLSTSPPLKNGFLLGKYSIVG